MRNLASAYHNRIRYERVDNIEQAITAYQQALQVMTREAMPIEWAHSMHNLANAYRDRIFGDHADNIEQAIIAYRQALQVMTRKAMPVEWATLMMNLANAYCDRIQGPPLQSLEQAIAAYKDSLEFFTPELFPDYCRQAAHALGNLYFSKRKWEDAASIYQIALQAAEVLYQSADLLDSKTAQLKKTDDLPQRAAYALARTGHLRQAVEILEQSRARGLSDSLGRDRADLIRLKQTHPSLYQTYQALVSQIRTLEHQQRNTMTSEERHSITPKKLRNGITHLYQQLSDIVQQVCQIQGYKDFLSAPTFTDIKKAVQQDTPLVYLISVSSVGSLALIITPNAIHDLWIDTINEEQLIELLNRTWLSADGPSQNKKQLIDPLKQLGQELHFPVIILAAPRDRADRFDAIDFRTREICGPLMAPVVACLQRHQFQRATLIPVGYLSFLPLHAAWTKDPDTPTERRYALDEIHFTYTPNARSLNAARAISQHSAIESILAVDNPRQDLSNSEREIEAAIAAFPKHTVLTHDNATVEAVKATLEGGVEIAHFSCHGHC